LISSSQNTVWKSWVLNTFPNADSLNKAAIRSKDSLNNIQQITLQRPVAGHYKIRVKGYNVITSDQSILLLTVWIAHLK
jgi:hypothetical protein